jgi:hypothetical protein
MTTTPAGNPAWARTGTFADYGGDPNKANFLRRSGLDALTDVNAEQFARLTADLEAAARTVPLLVAFIGLRRYQPGCPDVWRHSQPNTG